MFDPLMVLGYPLAEWARIRAVMVEHRLDDADALADRLGGSKLIVRRKPRKPEVRRGVNTGALFVIGPCGPTESVWMVPGTGAAR